MDRIIGITKDGNSVIGINGNVTEMTEKFVKNSVKDNTEYEEIEETSTKKRIVDTITE